MGAVGITLVAFACWGVIGYALTSSLLPRRQALSNLLLAPVIGMGTLELLAHIGLRCGSPIGPIAHELVLGALLFAITVLVIRRPPFPIRRVLPFGLIILTAIPLSGWPLFRWGYDWVANANGDMANYCVGATGFREHGFRTLQVDEYFNGKDLTYEMWLLYGDEFGTRHGSEMSLAITSALVSRPAPFIFMPIILAMHLVLISSVGFLLHRLAGGRVTALITCALMAVSPLSTFGVVQQLIGQVGGLAILVAGAGFFLRPARRLPTYAWVKRGILGGIIAATLMLHYTESAPFLVAGFGLHVAVGFARGSRDLKQLAIAVLSAALVVPLLGDFLVANISFLVSQAVHDKAHPILVKVFPQYLNADGFARLWGLASLFEPVVKSGLPPWPVHRLVAAGVLGVMLSLTAGIALAWRRQPVGVMLLVIGGVAVVLLRGMNAFGLFKLAMYAQPFILGSIVLGWARMNPGYWKWAGLVCLLALVPPQLSTQRTYVSSSETGPTAGGETPGATEERLFTQYRRAFQTPGAKRFVVPVNDMVSRKLVACYGHGVTLCVPSFDPKILTHPCEPAGSFRMQWRDLLNFPPRLPKDGTVWLTPPKGSGSIDLFDPNAPGAAAELISDMPSWLDRPEPGDYLLEPPERFALFNRFHRASNTQARASQLVPLSQVSNYLIWRQTSKSKMFHAFLGVTSGLCALQTDLTFPRETMAASGQYLTFQVLNPSPRARLMISGTATFIPGTQDLPPAAIVGDRRVMLPLAGQGAARVVSEPISVQTVGTSQFLLLDLAPSAAINPAANSSAPDARQISLYLRDVSLLSEEEYAALVPPECLRAFPADLAQKHVEFSGCGEEGSVGKHSWFRLSQPQTSAPLVVRGRLASEDSGTPIQNELQLKWNGVQIWRQAIGSREFEVRVPPPPGGKAGKLELEFSEAYSRPPSVTRLVSAQLTFVGFEPIGP